MTSFNVPLAGEQRRRVVEDVQSTSVSVHHVWGTVKVEGPGELSVQVDFPVTFTEKPGLFFGGEVLDPDYSPGGIPSVSGVALKWTSTKVVAGNYYGGMLLGIVCTGRFREVMFHWHAEGFAFRNPTQYDGNVEAY